MIGAIIKYQVSIFSSAIGIRYDATNISYFLRELESLHLLPEPYQEMTPFGSETKLRMTSPSGLSIDFGSQRIDIEQNAKDQSGSNIGELRQFCENVIFMARVFSDKMGMLPSRLALVTMYYLEDLPSEKLSKLYVKSINPIKFFEENDPVEWGTRTVARVNKTVNNIPEIVNVLVEISRIPGFFKHPDGSVTSLDKMRLQIDTNTFHGNTTPRFNFDSIQSFCHEAQGWQNVVLNDVIDSLK
ncbi:hypothetical protein [Larkinella sp.]|uniref:hypothetical protein n=1 Tax=Larkinella sp. TaxID=2034517 RepID=UPI003BAC3AC6